MGCTQLCNCQNSRKYVFRLDHARGVILYVHLQDIADMRRAALSEKSNIDLETKV
jgi:hypothetical protein